MIPGFIISLITFPGVVIHELAHKKFCGWTGVRVEKVVYFRLGNPAGYVIHEEPKNYSQIFWVSVGPLIINSLVAIILVVPAVLFKNIQVLSAVLAWVAISAGMNSFPSNQDMKNVWQASKKAIKNGGNVLYYLAFPFVALIWIANLLKFFWFDLIYTVLLVLAGVGIANYLLSI